MVIFKHISKMAIEEERFEQLHEHLRAGGWRVIVGDRPVNNIQLQMEEIRRLKHACEMAYVHAPFELSDNFRDMRDFCNLGLNRFAIESCRTIFVPGRVFMRIPPASMNPRMH